jgi:hypothetical protein
LASGGEAAVSSMVSSGAVGVLAITGIPYVVYQ